VGHIAILGARLPMRRQRQTQAALGFPDMPLAPTLLIGVGRLYY
jgi:hypothetical protein